MVLYWVQELLHVPFAAGFDVGSPAGVDYPSLLSEQRGVSK